MPQSHNGEVAVDPESVRVVRDISGEAYQAPPSHEVEYVDARALVPYERNPRTHSAAQVAQIAASIAEFGFTNPILIDESLGVIAGHGRLLAASELGMPVVPCIRLVGLSEAQRRALVIADNKLALNAGWDPLLLGSELKALDALDFDLTVTGFTAIEVDQLLAPDLDPSGEWRGMPEFDQQDKTSFQSVVVHFKDQAAVDQFAALVEQKITRDTRFMWYPLIEIETYADKQYTTAEPFEVTGDAAA